MSLDKAERRKTFALFFCGRQRAGGKAPPASLHLATSPLREEAFSRAKPAQKRLPTQWGDSPLRGEMSRSDRGVRVRRTGRACEV